MRIAAIFLLVAGLILPASAQAQLPPQGDLANARKDPGERKGGGAGEPSVRAGRGNWWWGELTHGQNYQTTLTVTNDCETAETATIFINGLPLTAPNSVNVPAKSSVDVAMTITIARIPETELPRPRGAGFIAKNIDGNVVIWHPWTRKCLPRRDQYDAGGFVIAPPPGDFQKVGGPNCNRVRDLGKLPSTFEERVKAMRADVLTPEKEEDKCGELVNDLDIDLKNEIKRMTAADRTLEAPAGPALDLELSTLSTEQLTGLRDQLKTRAAAKGGQQ